jgi:DNA modification methylase
MSIEILEGNCLDTLKQLPDQCVNTCITSPPYWGLRDYGTATWIGGDPNCNHMRDSKVNPSGNTDTGHKAMFEKDNAVGDAIYKSECPKCGAKRKDQQLGIEETPDQFVENLVNVFREVRRVLKDDGTVWLNLGDSYCGTGHKKDSIDPLISGGKARNGQKFALNNKIEGLKSKDLVGIPWKVAFALQADGWYLRQDIIWHKPNPMPESVKDRCTKSHEYIFLLSKNAHYYFDHESIKVESSQSTENGKSNKRSVWTVTTKPYSEAHFATYPHDLIIPCIKAGCPENGTVLDPFGGSGTTAQVAAQLNRNAIICELNSEYIKIANQRLLDSLGMFLDLKITKPQSTENIK